MKADRGEVIDPRSKKSSLPELETQLRWFHLQSSADPPSSFPISGIRVFFDSILFLYNYNCEPVMLNCCVKLGPIWNIASSQYTRSLVGMSYKSYSSYTSGAR